jgi:hypothetical protein
MEMELDCHLNMHCKLSGSFFLFILISHFRSLVSQSRKMFLIFGGETSILCIYSIGIGYPGVVQILWRKNLVITSHCCMS